MAGKSAKLKPENVWRTETIPDGMKAAIDVVANGLDAGLVKRLRAIDFAKDYAAWKERVLAAVESKAPPADLDHLQFVLIYAPTAKDKKGMYSEVIVGGHPGHVPDDNDFEAYYEGYCPYPDYIKGYSSALTDVYRIFMSEDGDCADEDALDALEMAYMRLCAAHLCQDKKAAAALLANVPHRYIYAGRNEVLDLLGVLTKKGWKAVAEGKARGSLQA